MTGPNRRRFLQTCTAVAAAAASTTLQIRQADAAEKPLFRISLAQWSLNRRFFKREEPHLDNLDFAKTARGFGIEAIEYVNQFFKDKGQDQAYLAEMKKRAADEGVKSLLIMIDGEGNLGEPDEAKRKQAVEKHYKWVEAAKFLGCHSIRVNARSNAKLSYEEQAKLAADGLRQLSEFGDKHEIDVIVENHGGLSSHGRWLVEVMQMVDHPRCGTLPDFGNFAIDRKNDIWYDRYLGVQELMPYAKAVSAKAHAFDESKPWSTVDAAGHETDFVKMMKIVLDAGYRGWVGIESEGRQNQMEGVQQTLDLLKRVRAKLHGEYKV